MTLFLASVLAAAPGSVSLEGPGLKAGAVSLAELQALPASTFEWKEKLKKADQPCAAPARRVDADSTCVHQAKGLRLDRLLLARGFSEGASGPQVDPKLKHAGLRAVLVASAGDGFRAVFSVGELLESLGATTAFLTWEVDGQPLDAKTGPLRLLVTSDQGSSRSIQRVEKLTLTAVP